jgi:hypothetical protein
MTAHRTASEGTAMTIEPSTEALFSAAIAGGRDGAPTMGEVRREARAAERTRRRALLTT